MGLRTSSSISGGISGSSVLSGGSAVSQIFAKDITFTAGAIAALVSTVVTQTVTFPTEAARQGALGFGADRLGMQTMAKLAGVAETL